MYGAAQALEWVAASDGVRRTEEIAKGFATKGLDAISFLAPSAEKDALADLMNLVLSRSK